MAFLTSRGNGTQLTLPPSLTALGLAVLDIAYPSYPFLTTFFDSFRQLSGFFPQLQKLCRSVIDDQVQASVYDIVRLAGTSITARMNLEGCGRLQSFRAVSKDSFDFHPESTFEPWDVQLSNNLKASGMDIHIGTETESVI